MRVDRRWRSAFASPLFLLSIYFFSLVVVVSIHSISKPIFYYLNKRGDDEEEEVEEKKRRMERCAVDKSRNCAAEKRI